MIIVILMIVYMGNSKINQNFFSKKIIACSVKYCFPMCSGMFEVYKNRNILQFAQFFVSQSHLEDDGSDAPRLLHGWHFFVRH